MKERMKERKKVREKEKKKEFLIAHDSWEEHNSGWRKSKNQHCFPFELYFSLVYSSPEAFKKQNLKKVTLYSNTIRKTVPPDVVKTWQCESKNVRNERNVY